MTVFVSYTDVKRYRCLVDLSPRVATSAELIDWKVGLLNFRDCDSPAFGKCTRRVRDRADVSVIGVDGYRHAFRVVVDFFIDAFTSETVWKRCITPTYSSHAREVWTSDSATMLFMRASIRSRREQEM